LLLTRQERAAPVREAAGCGVDLCLSFPFLDVPPDAVLRGEVSFGDALRDAPSGAPLAAFADLLHRRLPGAAPARAYVGNETCERLLPSPRSLDSWVAASRATGWAVTLLLPPLGGEGQMRALECARVLAEETGAEVVANDWGTVHRLRKCFRDLPISLGRLTHKMLRDPRLAEYFDSPQAPAAARSALCRSGELAPGFRALMERYGIRRREIDPYLQPLEEREWEDRTEKLAVHLPYLFVTMGRACLLGAMHRGAAGKFVPGAPCRSECRKYAVEFLLPVPGESGAGKPLLNLGNAYYHAVPPSVAERILGLLPSRPQVDRIVFTVPAVEKGAGG